MRIDLNTVFHFGKHKGKDFRTVYKEDRSYIHFLFRKGFKFDHNCTHVINNNTPIQTEIRVNYHKTKDEARINKVEFVDLGKTTVVINKELLETIDISHIPHKTHIERVEKHGFDSTAFQMDDRFYSYIDEKVIKIYDELELQNFIRPVLEKYEIKK